MSFGQLDAAGWTIALAVGFFAGVVSGLMGIGGGNILVPASTVLLALTQHQAQGVSLVVIIPTALVGAYSHWRHGHVQLRAAQLIAGGAVVAALAGARLAQVVPGQTLRTIFGIILLYFGLRYLGLWGSLRRRVFPGVPRAVVEPPPVPPPEDVPADVGRAAL